MTSPLAEKAVVADLTISRWSGRKLDKKITDEVNSQYDADDDAGRWNKQLLPKKAFAEINQVVHAARAKHLAMTLPWASNRRRILPMRLFDDFSAKFRKLEAEFETAANNFARDYPKHKQDQKKRLKSMYNEEDYPHAPQVRDLFSFAVSIDPIPDAGHFLVDLSKDQEDKIKRDLETQIRATLGGSVLESAQRVVDVVEKMATRLKAYKPATETNRAENTFRNSLVTNIEDLLPLLEAFNLTGDKKLATITARIQKELIVNDAETLREDDAVRAKVAKSAEDILKQAQALMA